MRTFLALDSGTFLALVSEGVSPFICVSPFITCVSPFITCMSLYLLFLKNFSKSSWNTVNSGLCNIVFNNYELTSVNYIASMILCKFSKHISEVII